MTKQFKNNDYMFNLKYLEWDTKILGIKSGIVDIISYSNNNISIYNLFELLNKYLKDNNYKLITIKHIAEDVHTVNFLLQNKAILCDTELSFIKKVRKDIKETKFNDNIIIINKYKIFWNDLFYVFSKALNKSRFFNDPNILINQAEELWKQSIYNHCNGKADYLIVAFCNNNPVGLIIVNSLKDTDDLFLVSVLPEFQGLGIGKKMIKYVEMKTNKSFLTVSTQSINYAAQNLYSKAGFVNNKTKQIIHYWL